MWTLERAIAELECVPAVMVCAAIGSTDETASNVAIARYFEMKSFLYIGEVPCYQKSLSKIEFFFKRASGGHHESELVVSGKSERSQQCRLLQFSHIA
jgi:hypothetical protein